MNMMRPVRTTSTHAPAAAAIAVAASLGLASGTAWATGADPAKGDLVSSADVGKTPAAAGAGAGPKVLVLPYQPIYRSVPQRKAQVATDFLNKELVQRDHLVVVRGAVAQEGAQAPSLEEANALAAEATRLEGERRIQQAVDARKKALEAMEKNASAIVDADEYFAAHHLLARAQMWAGRDDEARATVEVAARMAPTFELDAEAFSRLYRKWFDEAAERVVKEKRGELLVRSVLPGAKITLDGREMDVAPVALNQVVPGKHLIGATVDGVPAYRTVVQVPSGKKSEVTANFGGTVGGDAVGDVTDAIAKNGLPRAAVEKAVQAGKAVGATFVVAGGMAKDENHFNVHTFVVNVPAGTVRAVDVVNFDLDLLTAESDVLRVVQAVDSAIKSFGNGQQALAVVEKRIREQSTVNEVNATPPTRVAGREVGTVKKGPRGPVAPLKGGTITIKDEEE